MKSVMFLALLALSGPAFAQGAPADHVMPGDAGSRPPGGLSPGDVNGKWLLDSNGATLGRIESATADSASVRTQDGKRISVEMARLSLGNGPNTVIRAGNSEADRLNKVEAGVR